MTRAGRGSDDALELGKGVPELRLNSVDLHRERRHVHSREPSQYAFCLLLPTTRPQPMLQLVEDLGEICAFAPRAPCAVGSDVANTLGPDDPRSEFSVEETITYCPRIEVHLCLQPVQPHTLCQSYDRY